MSAAERLRVLSQAPYPYRVPSVMDALPEIIAVVEAAEAVRGDIPWTTVESLRDALRALTEKLEA